jgi:hypothetical protein
MHLVKQITRVLTEPVPLRFLLLRWFDRRLDLVDYPSKLNIGSLDYANYGYGLLHAAYQARKLGHAHIAAVEFGVAGGNGLVALEMHARYVHKHTGVAVSVFGFDTGNGMPPPMDHRDTPYLLEGGYQVMDRDKLVARLSAAQLMLGPLEDTVPEFCERYHPPPIGFIAFDLGYYSSTWAALKIFDAEVKYFLPRAICFLNDAGGGMEWALNEYVGGYLAFQEFNRGNRNIVLAKVAGLRFAGPHIPRLYHEQIFVAHMFEHPEYALPINEQRDLPLH